MTGLYVALFIVCVSLSAFFCSSETAFFALQRLKLEELVAEKVHGANRVAALLSHPEKLLSVVLLGTNLANTAAAVLGTALAVSLLGEQRGVVVATAAVTVVLLVVAETTPKTLASQHAAGLALLFARPLGWVSWLFSPVVWLLGNVSSGLMQITGNAPLASSLISTEEIRTMISVGHKEGTVEEHEAKLLHGVFEFGDRPAREVMIPRPEVVAIEQGSKFADFLKLYSDTPLSRFPVYNENMDNVIGILSVKDVLMAMATGKITEGDLIDELVRPAYFAPETKPIDELFVEMRDDNFRMCVVIDEFGGTAGVVSLSRLVEEIVGEVGDELAAVEKDYEIINEYTFQIDGSMRVEEVNEEMELNLPDGDYETVAGFILNLLGHIPKQNEQLRYKELKIVITEMKGLKIEQILVTKERQAAAAQRVQRRKRGTEAGKSSDAPNPGAADTADEDSEQGETTPEKLLD